MQPSVPSPAAASACCFLLSLALATGPAAQLLGERLATALTAACLAGTYCLSGIPQVRYRRRVYPRLGPRQNSSSPRDLPPSPREPPGIEAAAVRTARSGSHVRPALPRAHPALPPRTVCPLTGQLPPSPAQAVSSLALAASGRLDTHVLMSLAVAATLVMGAAAEVGAGRGVSQGSQGCVVCWCG